MFNIAICLMIITTCSTTRVLSPPRTCDVLKLDDDKRWLPKNLDEFIYNGCELFDNYMRCYREHCKSKCACSIFGRSQNQRSSGSLVKSRSNSKSRQDANPIGKAFSKALQSGSEESEKTEKPRKSILRKSLMGCSTPGHDTDSNSEKNSDSDSNKDVYETPRNERKPNASPQPRVKTNQKRREKLEKVTELSSSSDEETRGKHSRGNGSSTGCPSHDHSSDLAAPSTFSTKKVYVKAQSFTEKTNNERNKTSLARNASGSREMLIQRQSRSKNCSPPIEIIQKFPKILENGDKICSDCMTDGNKAKDATKKMKKKELADINEQKSDVNEHADIPEEKKLDEKRKKGGRKNVESSIEPKKRPINVSPELLEISPKVSDLHLTQSDSEYISPSSDVWNVTAREFQRRLPCIKGDVELIKNERNLRVITVHHQYTIKKEKTILIRFVRWKLQNGRKDDSLRNYYLLDNYGKFFALAYELPDCPPENPRVMIVGFYKYAIYSKRSGLFPDDLANMICDLDNVVDGFVKTGHYPGKVSSFNFLKMWKKWK